MDNEKLDKVLEYEIKAFSQSYETNIVIYQESIDRKAVAD